ncbi:RpiB/LacA/LacB family sugar-phosphate isomerase [Kitasatospora sp. NPDC059088]|uniref:RpiB/LacA/LacB family sugar-phosphate isomerase n=1 Tax=Kitasatospora sp. NPDC059088 TaxID=3346722 RepID=UPI00367DA264
MPAPLRIALGSDPAGSAYRRCLAADLTANRLVGEVITLGGDTPQPYPLVAFAGAQLVASGAADRALLVCHTGAGMAIAANKVRGVRAATCRTAYEVAHAVTYNNAQVLCLGQGLMPLGQALLLTRFWLTQHFDPASRAAEKVALITASEQHP